jgi:PqqD family protein of HPr-rel-A system
VTASETWSLRPGQTLQYRQWDGESVLYNDLSGDTHLLGEAAIVLLQALRNGPATCLALAAILKTEFETDETDEVIADVVADMVADVTDYAAEAEALLLDLKRLYLVDAHAC